MPKRTRMSNAIKQRLNGNVRKQRRETIYKMMFKKHGGYVACYVCGEHVNYQTATLEHIKPKSKGGTDEMKNLTISHKLCNEKRGNTE